MMRLSNDYWNESKSQRGLTEKSDMWNTIDPKETKEIIRNERDTLHSRAQSALDDESGGRFSKISPSKVTGATPVTYPRLPSGPWSEGDPGAPDSTTNELGYRIDEVEAILERRDDATSNGPTPAVASAPESPERIAGLSTPTASARVGSSETLAGEPVDGSDRLSSQPSRKSFKRRF
jgi:hypothetical protein